MIESRSALTSLCIHALAILLLFTWVVNRSVTPPAQPLTTLHLPLLSPYLAKAAPMGGGAHALTPASAGHAPPKVARQFLPPMLAPVNLQPKLVMAVTMEAPPSSTLAALGDPNALASLLSGGRGGPAGIGDGIGNQLGPGENGTGSGGPRVYRSGHGVTLPVAIRKVEPEYSEDARKARVSGVVTVNVEIGPDGKPHNLRLARSIGLGLDEKALEAVAQWLFRPGTKDGKPVTVAASIEVAFHLL